MQEVTQIIYRFITNSEYFNIYRPALQGGGGQRYFDFPTSTVSVAKWRSFFADVANVVKTEEANGPHWAFPVFNASDKTGRQTPAFANIYQRRKNTVCIGDQGIDGNRLPAWHPSTGFPVPGDPSVKNPVPLRLAVFLAKTTNGAIWAGWFESSTEKVIVTGSEASDQLARMLDKDNEPGSAGIIECTAGTLFLNDDNADLPTFLGKQELRGNELTRLQLRTLTISGFKSLKHARCSFSPLNVLIGPNGAGKSNLISLLQLILASLHGKTSEFVQARGGANAVLHLGTSTTTEILIRAEVQMDANAYTIIQRFAFKPPDELYGLKPVIDPYSIEEGEVAVSINDSCIVIQAVSDHFPAHQVVERLQSQIAILHLLDTSITAPIRQSAYINDNFHLRSDGSNLAALLYCFKQKNPKAYKRICATIRRVVPYFDDFVLEPMRLNPSNILLNWREKGKSYMLGPHQISDGTLRLMAIITMLLQPTDSLPDIVVIDEPELGLHPTAKSIVAGLLLKASRHCQVLVATQSASLLENFSADNVLVVERDNGVTTFKNLDTTLLNAWLDEYTIGELWEKNVLGGGPS